VDANPNCHIHNYKRRVSYISRVELGLKVYE